jgi:hypothetical protein
MIGNANRLRIRTPSQWSVIFVAVVLVAGCAEGPTVTSTPTVEPPATIEPAVTPGLPAPTPTGSLTPTPKSGWSQAAPMPRERAGFDAVLMGDGTVLVVGNDDPSSDRAAPGSELVDVYDPATDTWRPAGSLNKPRTGAATVVGPNGTALVIGGTNSDGQAFSSTKILAAATGSWGAGPLMKIARSSPEAVVLGSGHVLVVDQADGHPANTTSELLSPRGTAWSTRRTIPGREVAIDALVRAGNHRALALGWERASGVADSAEPTARYYDAFFDTWKTVPVPKLQVQPALVTLPDGRVLAVGGNGGGELVGHPHTVATVRVFDPARAKWTNLAPMAEPRESAQVALLADGFVLVAGGMQRTTDGSGPPRLLASSEIYDPATDSWSAGPALLEPRAGGTAITLRDGTVLALGGEGSIGRLVTVERLWPDASASSGQEVNPALAHWDPIGQLPFEDEGQLIGFDKGYVYLGYMTWYSPDGKDWEVIEPQRDSTCDNPDSTADNASNVWAAATNGHEVMLVGYKVDDCTGSFTPASWITSDGVTWEQSTSVEPTKGSSDMREVWAVPGGWEASVYLDAIDGFARWVSMDGLTWRSAPALPIDLSAVAADGTRVGIRHRKTGAKETLVASTEGRAWHVINPPVRGGVSAVVPPAAAGDSWIVVSETETRMTFAASRDLVHWSSVSGPGAFIDGITQTRSGVFLLSSEPCWDGLGAGPAPSAGPPDCPADGKVVIDLHMSADGLRWRDVVTPGPLVAIADGPAGTLAVEWSDGGSATRVWRLDP